MMSEDQQRQQRILELVRSRRFASIDSLSQQVGADPETIRNDIAALFDGGQLDADAGGDLRSTVENLAYVTRQALFHGEKERIAKALASHIPDRSSLIVNIGTTNEEVAKALMTHRKLRVVTNNLHVADIMCGNPDFEVIIAGGIVRSRDRGVVGEATIDLIRQFRVDFGIIGISGIDETGALLDFDYREVRVAQAIIEQSRKVYLVTDHSKFDRRPMVRVGHLSQLDAVFTDRPLPSAMQDQLGAAGVQLIVAD
ncbi:MAG: DeoR family transcriptional regulator [Rhodospirillales bacterium]|nr:DeoR family transcriptional regulator [Rhodospirillales bacterium]